MWAFLAVGAGVSIPLTIHISNDPRLSENRTKAGPAAEQRSIQKIIVLLSGLPAVAAFIVPGLDRRFGWSDMPPWLSIAGDLMILAAMWTAFLVFRETAFGSATVEVARGQKVISTGPYALVPHPMCASAAVYFVGVALALGSAWGLVPALLTIAGLVFRLFDEESFLLRIYPATRTIAQKFAIASCGGFFDLKPRPTMRGSRRNNGRCDIMTVAAALATLIIGVVASLIGGIGVSCSGTGGAEGRAGGVDWRAVLCSVR